MGNGSALHTLRHRVDRLERENRLLKTAGTIVFLVLVAVAAMGQVLPKVVPKVVEAEQFVVRDQNGKLRATLGMGLAGPTLDLWDQNGKLRATLNLNKRGGPALSLYAIGPPEARLEVLDDTPILTLVDQKSKPRARLALWKDGTPSLTLSDQNENLRAALSVGADGPGLSLFDEKRTRAVLGHTALKETATGTVEQRPASSLVLFDRDGKVIWRVP